MARLNWKGVGGLALFSPLIVVAVAVDLAINLWHGVREWWGGCCELSSEVCEDLWSDYETHR